MIIPENFFMYINIFIGFLYLALVIIGFIKGFIYEVVSLIYTALALVAAYFASPVLASLFPIIDITKFNDDLKLVEKFVDLNPLINTIIYFLLIFIFLKVVYIILSIALKAFNKIPVLGTLNKFLGALFGVLNATLITLAISMLLTLPLFSNGKQVKENTVLKYVDTYSTKAINYLVDNINLDQLTERFKDFDVEKAREDFKQFIIEYE